MQLMQCKSNLNVEKNRLWHYLTRETNYHCLTVVFTASEKINKKNKKL